MRTSRIKVGIASYGAALVAVCLGAMPDFSHSQVFTSPPAKAAPKAAPKAVPKAAPKVSPRPQPIAPPKAVSKTVVRPPPPPTPRPQAVSRPTPPRTVAQPKVRSQRSKAAPSVPSSQAVGASSFSRQTIAIPVLAQGQWLGLPQTSAGVEFEVRLEIDKKQEQRANEAFGVSSYRRAQTNELPCVGMMILETVVNDDSMQVTQLPLTNQPACRRYLIMQLQPVENRIYGEWRDPVTNAVVMTGWLIRVEN